MFGDCNVSAVSWRNVCVKIHDLDYVYFASTQHGGHSIGYICHDFVEYLAFVHIHGAAYSCVGGEVTKSGASSWKMFRMSIFTERKGQLKYTSSE